MTEFSGSVKRKRRRKETVSVLTFLPLGLVSVLFQSARRGAPAKDRFQVELQLFFSQVTVKRKVVIKA